MSRRKTTEEFIKEAKEVHGDRYDYSLVDYQGAKVNVQIICKEHGPFPQRPENHLKGQGCPKCGILNRSISRLHNCVDFIKKATEVHGNIYDYSLVNYINSSEPVKIVCKKHGPFYPTPNNHINKKSRCPHCYGSIRKTTKKFIKESKEVHGDRYDYSLVDYKDNRTKVQIVCKNHGPFPQTPEVHLLGCGCPKCNNSKGELRIERILKDNGIKYETQKRFKDCKNKKPLPFDFYLTDYNVCIEFDGKQHSVKTSIYYSDQILINDGIKNKYCEDKGIKLFRINYKQDVEEEMKIIIENLL